MRLFSDYSSVRILLHVEPQVTSFTLLHKRVDVAEKSLKLYLATVKKSENALSGAKDLGHNVDVGFGLAARRSRSCAPRVGGGPDAPQGESAVGRSAVMRSANASRIAPLSTST